MVQAYVLINARWGKALDVAEKLREQGNVNHADAITGDYDVIVQIEADSIASIGKLVVEKIQTVDGVKDTVTCFVVH